MSEIPTPCPLFMPRPPAIGPQSRAFWHPKIELRSIKKIRPAKRNARTYSKKQIEKLIGIIRRFGFINPIIIDENGVIVAVTSGWEQPSCSAWDATCR